METPFERHIYLSTACLHDRHDYCNSMVGFQGDKRPAMCKFCSAECICVCHNENSDPAAR